MISYAVFLLPSTSPNYLVGRKRWADTGHQVLSPTDKYSLDVSGQRGLWLLVPLHNLSSSGEVLEVAKAVVVPTTYLDFSLQKMAEIY